VVADTVAAPIEQQVNGIENMMYLSSQSSNDGSYNLTVTFRHGVDPDTAQVLVQNRVNLALSVLPDVVKQTGVTTRKKVGDKGRKEPPAGAGPNEVAIAVIDRGDQGWKELQNAAGALVKRLTAAGALSNPQVFPREEKQFFIDIDRAKCASLRVPVAEVFRAIQAAATKEKDVSIYINPHPAIQGKVTLGDLTLSHMKAEDLQKVIIRDTVTLRDVAVIKEVYGPAAVYRINLSPAIRITGAPPEGKSLAAAAARCVELAGAEMKRLDSRLFAVKNLSAK
jgi:multidrug efflux pump subunit AcrB